MKHNNTFFIQLSREIFTDKYNHFRTNEDLAKDCGLSLPVFKRAKSELIKTDLIQTWQSHYINKDGKKSEKHFSAYRIKK